MRRPRLILLILGVCRWGFCAAQDAPPAAPLSLAQYIEALDDSHRIAQKLKDDPSTGVDLLQALPESSWRVCGDGKDFFIPTAGFRSPVGERLEKNIAAVVGRTTGPL